MLLMITANQSVLVFTFIRYKLEILSRPGRWCCWN